MTGADCKEDNLAGAGCISRRIGTVNLSPNVRLISLKVPRAIHAGFSAFSLSSIDRNSIAEDPLFMLINPVTHGLFFFSVGQVTKGFVKVVAGFFV